MSFVISVFQIGWMLPLQHSIGFALVCLVLYVGFVFLRPYLLYPLALLGLVPFEDEEDEDALTPDDLQYFLDSVEHWNDYDDDNSPR